MPMPMPLRMSSGSTRPPRSTPNEPDPFPSIMLQMPILIVEDEMMIAWMLESMLEDLGFTAVELASDATEAGNIADRCPPHLIVSDINLGGGADGIESVLAIRARHPGSGAVIFISAYADDETRRRVAHELPKAQLLRKPIQPEQLREAIVRTVASAPH